MPYDKSCNWYSKALVIRMRPSQGRPLAACTLPCLLAALHLLPGLHFVTCLVGYFSHSKRNLLVRMAVVITPLHLPPSRRSRLPRRRARL